MWAKVAFGLFKDRVTSMRNRQQKSLFLADVWACLTQLRVVRQWRKCKVVTAHCIKACKRRALGQLRA